MKVKNFMPIAAAIVAVVTAMATMAFSKSKETFHTKNKAFATAIFQYDPPSVNPYSASNVSNPANWIYLGSSSSCNNANRYPCSIEVADMYYHLNDDSQPELNTSGSVVSIPTQQYLSTGEFYVASSGGTIAGKVNRN